MDFIKGQDLFGYAIDLNFRGNSTHNTISGGLFSLILKSFLAYFLFFKAKIMLEFDDDKIEKFYQSNLNFDDEVVALSDTDVFPFVIVGSNQRAPSNLPLPRQQSLDKRYVKA